MVFSLFITGSCVDALNTTADTLTVAYVDDAEDADPLGPAQYRDDLRSWAGQNKIRNTYGDDS